VKSSIILPIIVLFVACTDPEANSTIRGHISDTNGNPISNAKVVVSLTAPPTNGNTTIMYSLTRSTHAKIWISEECTDDTIRILVDEIQSPGEHSTYWNGYNSDSLLIKDGLYYFNFLTDSLNISTAHVLISDYMYQTYNKIVPFALTDEDGYFEFKQDCLPLDYSITTRDENGNILGQVIYSRSIILRAFHPDFSRGESDTLLVDVEKGVESEIKLH